MQLRGRPTTVTRRGATARARAVRHIDHGTSSGQSLVEFALVLPIILFLFALAADFSRLFFSHIQVTNAAREAVMFMAGQPDADPVAIEQRAIQETNAQGQTGEGSLTVTSWCEDASDADVPCTAPAATTVHVTAAMPFTFITPFVSSMLPEVTLSASGTTSIIAGLATATLPPTAPPTGGTPTPTPTATGGTPTPTPGPTPTPTPTPACVVVPGIEGEKPSEANEAISDAGLTPNGIGDLTTGQKDVAKNQSPLGGSCVPPGSTVTYHYRPR